MTLIFNSRANKASTHLNGRRNIFLRLPFTSILFFFKSSFAEKEFSVSEISSQPLTLKAAVHSHYSFFRSFPLFFGLSVLYLCLFSFSFSFRLFLFLSVFLFIIFVFSSFLWSFFSLFMTFSFFFGISLLYFKLFSSGIFLLLSVFLFLCLFYFHLRPYLSFFLSVFSFFFSSFFLPFFFLSFLFSICLFQIYVSI